MPVVGVSVPPLATPPAPITKEKLKEVAKEINKPAAIQEAVGGASNASPSHTLSPGRKGALEKGNVTRAYFGEDASMMACLLFGCLVPFYILWPHCLHHPRMSDGVPHPCAMVGLSLVPRPTPQQQMDYIIAMWALLWYQCNLSPCCGVGLGTRQCASVPCIVSMSTHKPEKS